MGVYQYSPRVVPDERSRAPAAATVEAMKNFFKSTMRTSAELKSDLCDINEKLKDSGVSRGPSSLLLVAGQRSSH